VTKEEKARDKYYHKKYGITLEEYNARDKEQNYVCGICHRPPGAYRLAVDHDHAHHYFKIRTRKVEGSQQGILLWEAYSPDIQFWYLGPSKNEAIKEVRKEIKRQSVRGLLCWTCNVGLRKWRDNPDLMESAAKYIRAFKDKQ
jgi:hypothetical protein